MNYIESLKTMEIDKIIHITLLFVSIISSGVILLYLYKPELIIQLSEIKLLLLSISLSLPVYIINYIMVFTISRYSKIPDNVTFGIINIMSTLISFIISYGLIIAVYLFNLTFKEYLYYLLIAELFIVSQTILAYRLRHYNQDTK